MNCYIYDDGNTYTLIDAGFQAPEYKAFFLKALADYGIKLENITRILLTHFHSDHTGLVKWLATEFNIPVYASKLAIPRIVYDQNYLERKVAIYESLYTQYGVLQYGEKRIHQLRQTARKYAKLQFEANIKPLKVGDITAGLKLLATRGHSPDSISFYDVDTGWLFGGDVLLEKGLASALLEYDENEQVTSAYMEYVTTLTKLKEMEISVLFPGHGDPFSNKQHVIELAMEKVEYKLEKVLKQIEAGQSTVEEICLSIYGPRFEQLFTFIVSDIIALIQLGEERGLIGRDVENGIFTFYINTERSSRAESIGFTT